MTICLLSLVLLMLFRVRFRFFSTLALLALLMRIALMTTVALG